MKIALFSDIHLEFEDWVPPSLDVDVVVLAGDIGPAKKSIEWAQHHFDIPVIFIPGNHEYYGQEYHATNRLLLKSAEKSNVTVLLNDVITIKGVEFVGTTFWTDYNLERTQDFAMYIASRSMNDFKRIKMDTGQKSVLFQPEHALQLNTNAVEFLEDVFARPNDRRVVITHHAPSKISLGENRKGSYLGPSYASNFDSLVSSSGAKLWLHGHTHHCVDYSIGEVRVVSNQRGYVPHEPVETFQENLVLEI